MVVVVGLYLFPSLFPARVQVALLDKLLHRDLSNPQHRTNLHLHYDIPYPRAADEAGKPQTTSAASFFASVNTEPLRPKDPLVHKPITISQMLRRKLRWMTLGGQYDWTNKVYPEEAPQPFPSDIATLFKGLFPRVEAQAAIVNLYTPGDTLSVHRDVSEECDRGLISVSIGCEGIFIVGNDDGSRSVTIRLRSGDAILMDGESRYAWHAVPRILPHTCPGWLASWPDLPPAHKFQDWTGWMESKRVNVNVRQMKIEKSLIHP